MGDSEIRVGNIMPYSGPLTGFSAIGQTESAFFDMINDRGGINGRKVKFISRDDGSNPATALDETRRLIDIDNVLLIFGSFGTPGNLAVRSYLNENKIPQLFAASGDEEWNKPAAFSGQWAGSLRFGRKGASTRILCRHFIRTVSLRCFGRTISSGAIC